MANEELMIEFEEYEEMVAFDCDDSSDDSSSDSSDDSESNSSSSSSHTGSYGSPSCTVRG